MINKEETLAAYIRKVLDVQDDQLSESHLRQLATELGLDDTDYEELQEIREDYITRGKGFLALQNWDDAIEEFRQAIALNPLRSDAHFLQAEAFEGKWQASGNKKMRAAALSHAKIILKYDPDHQKALELISRIRKASASPFSSQSTWIFLAILLVGGFLGFFLLNRPAAPPLPEPVPPVPQQAPLSQADPRPAGASFDLFSDFEIPVRWYLDRGESIELIPRTSHVRDYKKSHSYLFQGWVRVKKGEINRLLLNAELVLDDGTKWQETRYRVHDRPASGAREGDLLPIGFSLFEDSPQPGNIQELRLSVSEVLLESAPDAYAPSTPLSLTWSGPHNETQQLEVRARAYSLKLNSRYPYMLIGLEVKNTGSQSFDKLSIRAKWYDSQQALVLDKSIWIVGPNTPPLGPGVSYTIGRTFSLKDLNPDELPLPVIMVDKF